MFSILGWLIFGFFAGLVARFLMPGDNKMGCFATSILGIVGSVVGGFIGSLIFHGSLSSIQPAHFLGSVIGAVVVLWVASRFKDSK